MRATNGSIPFSLCRPFMKLNRLKAKRNSNFYISARQEKYDVKYPANAVLVILPTEVKKITLKTGKAIQTFVGYKPLI